MQGPNPPPAGSSRPPRPADAHALYVITLVSSPAPARLETPAGPEFAGLAVFRSRLVEDGRERFRVHIGYFPSAAAAERLLPAARRIHPAAFVTIAPHSDMGSLDDTAMARFRILQAPDASAPDPRPRSVPRRPAAPAGTVRLAPTTIPAATAARAPLPPVLTKAAVVVREPPRREPVARAQAPEPPWRKPVERAEAPAPPQREPVARAEAPEPPRSERVARAEAPEPWGSEPVARGQAPKPPHSEPAAQAEAQQKFAVQLMWTREPIDVTKISRLNIFNGYLLYAVETEPGGRREYGVRLGFYGDTLSAGLVAQYVRPVFKDATVVPVSEREFTRAAAAVIRVAPARMPGGRARWPATAVPVVLVRMAR